MRLEVVPWARRDARIAVFIKMGLIVIAYVIAAYLLVAVMIRPWEGYNAHGMDMANLFWIVAVLMPLGAIRYGEWAELAFFLVAWVLVGGLLLRWYRRRRAAREWDLLG